MTQQPDFLRIRCKITKARFLVDTGSTISILHAENYPPDNENDTAMTLQCANKGKITSRGTKTMKIDIGFGEVEHKFQCFANITEQILGRDFCAAHKLIIDFKEEKIDRPEREKVESQQLSKILSCNNINNTLKPEYQDITSLDKRVVDIIYTYPKPIDLNTVALERNPHFKFYIELKDDKPIRTKMRPVPIAMQEGVDKLLKDLERRNIIEPVYDASEWILPTRYVMKRDKTYRLTLDLRALNRKALKFDYNLPSLFSFQERLHNMKFISKIDLCSGYYLMALDERVQHIFTFQSRSATYRLKRAPMGQTSSSSHFQRFMDHLFRDLDSNVLVYIDDILCFTETEKQHTELLRKVFRILHNNNMVISIKKSQFYQSEVEFLGFRLTQQGILPTDEHIRQVTKFKLPEDMYELRKILGIFNFSRRFLAHASTYTAPLTKLLEKGPKRKKIKWTEEAKESFYKCRDKINEWTSLAYYNPKSELILYTDSSNAAAAGALFQKDPETGDMNALGFCSQTYSETQKKWCIFHKEFYSVLYTIQHFRLYLYGRHFKVYCDNTCVIQAFKRKDPLLSPQIEKILDKCLQYDMEIEYIPSHLNVVADNLSRLLTINNVICPVPKLDYNKIGKEQTKDEKLQQFMENPQGTNLKLETRELTTDQKIIGDTSTGRFRVYVPEKCTQKVWQFIHNWTHSGIKRTTVSIKRDFVWPGMDAQIKLYT